MEGLYRRGRIWWLRMTPAPGARQEFLSLGTDDEAAAIVLAREKLDQASRQVVRTREVAQSCAAEIAGYARAKLAAGLSRFTLEPREYVLGDFCGSLGVSTPRNITPEAVERWYAGRRKKNEHTAAAYLAIVRVWFAWLLSEGKITQNPAAEIRTPKLKMQVRKSFLLPEEARKLLEACTYPGLKFALYCGLHAGLRKQEVIEARPEWFDLNAKLLHVQHTPTFSPKGRDNRTIPLTDEFATWLKEYGKPAPYMLVAPQHRGGGHKPSQRPARYRYDFRLPYETLVAQCGLQVTFHDLRRTFASLLVSRGVSLYKVAKWMGDTNDVIEATYGHLIPQDDQINAAWK